MVNENKRIKAIIVNVLTDKSLVVAIFYADKQFAFSLTWPAYIRTMRIVCK